MSHVIDSEYWGGGFSHPLAHRVFSDRARLERWLRVEGALAEAQGELGLIPAWAGALIAARARERAVDFGRVLEGTRRTGHSLVPLVEALGAACGEPAGQYVHYGATTQDVQDTEQALSLQQIYAGLRPRLLALLEALAARALAWRDLVATGRTHQRPALPVAFGLKAASWLDELLRALGRFDELAPRAFAAQLFGAAGTMAGFGPRGPELLAAVARRLGLSAPDAPWHAARDRVAEFVHACALLAAGLARMANELMSLSRPEVDEVRFDARPGELSSSTMPHKHNPEDCEQIVSLYRLVKGKHAVLLDSMVLEHERDFRGVRLEWAVLPEVCHYTLQALDRSLAVVESARPHEPGIAANLERFRACLATERVMFALAPAAGKATAYRALSELCEEARREGVPLEQALRASPLVREHLDAPALDALFDPARYLGHSAEIVDRVAARARAALARPAPPGAEPAAPPSAGALRVVPASLPEARRVVPAPPPEAPAVWGRAAGHDSPPSSRRGSADAGPGSAGRLALARGGRP